ncbi:hypothetical protein IE077_002804 [Cardiosporidium cionae]|uniref:Uncharacterized protein n=1 Tax=Cardiosporidium cionae TaxID=476202 RepID=A0ABQ7J9X0_9APIC|nr:hypothetical protein IE077_002804 [Cardiosporidium cionae]|eukprot:KAF8820798.1 hypothetical protein IE077_002804 [Cardiosporidium cionae]
MRLGGKLFADASGGNEDTVAGELEQERETKNRRALDKINTELNKRVQNDSVILQLGVSPSLIISPLVGHVHVIERSYPTCVRWMKGIIGQCMKKHRLSIHCEDDERLSEQESYNQYYNKIAKIMRQQRIPLFAVVVISDESPVASLLSVFPYVDLSTVLLLNSIPNRNSMQKIEKYYDVQAKMTPSEISSDELTPQLIQLRPKFVTKPRSDQWKNHLSTNWKAGDTNVDILLLQKLRDAINSTSLREKYPHDVVLQALSNLRILRKFVNMGYSEGDSIIHKTLVQLHESLTSVDAERTLEEMTKLQSVTSHLIFQMQHTSYFSSFFSSFEKRINSIVSTQERLQLQRMLNELKIAVEEDVGDFQRELLTKAIENADDCLEQSESAQLIKIIEALSLFTEASQVKSDASASLPLVNSLCKRTTAAET